MSRRQVIGTPLAKSRKTAKLGLVFVTALGLAACGDGANLPFLQPTGEGVPERAKSTKLVERDVEAPDVFQVTEAGLWDGRPSIGGVWVAHPDVTDPERVIIRNNANGKFVIGALFRRERALPGPRIQASSDAADALGMLAGAPVELNVTALRKESIEPEAALERVPIAEGLNDSGPVETASLAAPSAAPIAEPATPEAHVAVPTSAPRPAAPPTLAPRATALNKPYIQIGIFSIQANATRTADQMRNAGIIPTVYEQSSSGKPFWRVVVGPAKSLSERSQLLKTVKGEGFSDAYAVTN